MTNLLTESVYEPGRLRDADRTAATASALPLLATYVADAPSWDLSPREDVTVSRETADLAGFVEMRVALAAARRLDGIIRRILGRASFQYTRTAEESIGTIRGQLDIHRYVRDRSFPQSPRRYPVQVLNRGYLTPENVLAAYASLWVLRTIERAPLHVLPPDAPERSELLERRNALAGLLQQPALAQARDAAEDVRRRRQLARLVDQVGRRLESGRVAAADRYRRLVEWVDDFNPDAVAQPGVVEWLFYDARFDTKLFEIWVLALLLQELTDQLGPPTVGPRPLYERGRYPIALWKLGSATVGLHFQASLAKLAAVEPRWRYIKPQPAPLRGFPDVAVTIDTIASGRRVVIVDPKLRERPGPPTEELYKLLGYFGNLPAATSPSGAIVFYAPGAARTYELEEETGARMLAVGVDPSASDGSAPQIKAMTEAILSIAGVSSEALAQLAAVRAGGDADAVEEATTAFIQEHVIASMKTTADTLPPGTLDPVRKSVAAQLNDVWDVLSSDVQTMLVTAEYFGLNAPEDADHSGPLLGLAAACERLLYDGLFDLLGARHPHLFPASLTFGTLVYHLNDAFRPQPKSAEGKAIHAVLTELNHVDATELRRLVSGLRDLNVRYRIPAAHRDVVTQQIWVGGRSQIFVPPAGVLRRLANALHAER